MFGFGSQFRGFLELEETQGRVAQQPSRASTLAHIVLSAPVPGTAAGVRPHSLAPCPSLVLPAFCPHLPQAFVHTRQTHKDVHVCTDSLSPGLLAEAGEATSPSLFGKPVAGPINDKDKIDPAPALTHVASSWANIQSCPRHCLHIRVHY